ncbi:MAG: ArnT family glycosyltransferase, partial [Pseudomonadota bacterium]
WVYRLPSLIGGTLAVLLTAWIGAALFDRRVGFLAGMAMASCLILGVEARLAKTDAVLLACLVAQQGALWQIWSRRDLPDSGGPWWLLFWVALGGALLVKLQPLLAIFTVLTVVLWERRVDWLLRLRPLWGLVVLAAMVAPWFVLILLRSDGAFLEASLGQDIFGKVLEAQETHGAPPGTYLALMWATAWPFVALVPLAAVWAWRNRSDDRVRFLVAWIVPFWLVFELVATKLPHYVMPTYPALAIAAAAALLALDRRRPWLIGLPLALVVVLGLGLAVAAVAVTVALEAPLGYPILTGAVLAGLLLLLGARATHAGSRGRAITGITAAALVLYGTIFGLVLPQARALWISPAMADAVALHAPCPDPTVASVGFAEPSAVFLIGTDLRLAAAAEAADLLAGTPCALVFVDERHQAAFEAALTEPVRTLDRIRGWRINGGRWTTLTLYGN